MNPLATAMELLSPAGNRARLSIFIFHRVLPAPDPLFPEEASASKFRRLLEWIAAWFNVLPLDQAVERLTSGTLPARAASITFDDGYADNVSVALPILLTQQVTATFFIATGFLDGGCMWNDRIIAAIRNSPDDAIDLSDIGLGRFPLSSMADRRGAVDALITRIKYRPAGERDLLANAILGKARVRAPADLMMTSSDVRMLRQSGMQIGAHTVSHPILANVQPEQARREVIESKIRLEELVQEPVQLFAYPNGKPGIDYLAPHATIVREAGFAAAVSTSWGTANRGTDPMQLPRFTPWDRTRGKFGVRLLANMMRRATPAPTSPLNAGRPNMKKEKAFA